MTPDEQLDAIVGEAIKALVEAGASAQFIGSFSIVARQRFGQHLGAPAEQPPDLKAVISEAVTQAVQKALGASQPDPGEERLRMQVVCAGKRTSVTLRKNKVEQLIGAVGSRESSMRVIRELAGAASDPVENRSLWLEGQIDAWLQLQAQPQSGPRH